MPVGVYPNPTSGLATISFPKESLLQSYSLFDNLGRLISIEPANVTNGEDLEINLAELDAGIYSVCLRFDRYDAAIKLIKLGF